MGILNRITAVFPIMNKEKERLIISTDAVASHAFNPASAVYSGTKFMVQSNYGRLATRGKRTWNSLYYR